VTDYESELFAILDARNSVALKEGQLRLMAQPRGATMVAEHWISVLLAWRMQGTRMDSLCAEKLLERLSASHLAACDGTIFDAFLPRVANAILGVDEGSFEVRVVRSPEQLRTEPVEHRLLDFVGRREAGAE